MSGHSRSHQAFPSSRLQTPLNVIESREHIEVVPPAHRGHRNLVALAFIPGEVRLSVVDRIGVMPGTPREEQAHKEQHSPRHRAPSPRCTSATHTRTRPTVVGVANSARPLLFRYRISTRSPLRVLPP